MGFRTEIRTLMVMFFAALTLSNAPSAQAQICSLAGPAGSPLALTNCGPAPQDSLSLAQSGSAITRSGPTYSVKVVPGLGGTQWSPFGITNRGSITGDANLADDQTEHGFLNSENTDTNTGTNTNTSMDLGTLGGPNSGVGWPQRDNTDRHAGATQTRALDPYHEGFGGFICNNQTGQACLGNDVYQTVPYVWQDGLMSPLPTLGGINGSANGVASNGLIAGALDTTTMDPSCAPPQVFDFVGVYWDATNQLHPLAVPNGDEVAFATGINASAHAIGFSGPCGFTSATLAHAVLWIRGSRPIELATLGGAQNNAATDINDHGDIVGSSDLTGDTVTHAVMWKWGTHQLVDLGTLSGDVSSIAFAINNRRQVVGQSCDANFNCRAFLWQDGVMMDLNALVSAPPVYMLTGFAINDRGEVVGQGFDKLTGGEPGFLAVPLKDETDDTSGATTVATTTRALELPASIQQHLAKSFFIRR